MLQILKSFSLDIFNIKKLYLFFIASWIIFFNPKVYALPAPMSEEEIFSISDLVAIIEVIGVKNHLNIEDHCLNYEDKRGEGIIKPKNCGNNINYAWARVELVKKSSGVNVFPGDMLLLCWKNIPKGIVGRWSVPFEQGERSESYLIWDEKNRCYTATYWHGKKIL